MRHKNVAIWKAALLLFVRVECYQHDSNIATLINVPLLILRKIKYLQYTEEIAINGDRKILITMFVQVFDDIVFIVVQIAVIIFCFLTFRVIFINEIII